MNYFKHTVFQISIVFVKLFLPDFYTRHRFIKIIDSIPVLEDARHFSIT